MPLLHHGHSLIASYGNDPGGGESVLPRAGGIDALQILNEQMKGLTGGPSQPSMTELLTAVMPIDSVWRDRVQREEVEPVPDDRTVGGLVTKYLSLEMSRFEAGAISASEFDLTRLCLNYFREWAHPETPIERIDADRWELYYQHLLGASGAIEYRKKRLRYARHLLAWAASKGTMPLLPNLNSRKYQLGNARPSIAIYSVEEVRYLIAKAKGPLRLHLLLMINTGMTQGDIAELQQDEVDWSAGRLIRRRSKTKGHSSVPMVDWLLWPKTFRIAAGVQADRGGSCPLDEFRTPLGLRDDERRQA